MNLSVLMGLIAGSSRPGKAFLWTDDEGRRHASWHVWVLVWVTPAVFLAAVAALTAESWIRTHQTVPAIGEVVRVYDWDGEYSPVFRYAWSDGTMTEASTGYRDAAWNFAIGSTHPIRYFADEKRDVVLEGQHNWFVVRAIGLVTLASLAVSVFIHAGIRRWQRRSTPSAHAEKGTP